MSRSYLQYALGSLKIQTIGGINTFLTEYIVGQGPTALAVGASGGWSDIFSPSIIFLFFLPLSARRPGID